MKNLLWGIDLGGTKIECAVLEENTSKVLSRQRIATEQEGGYQHILNQIATLLRIVIKETGHKPSAIGIGTPGAIDSHSGRLKNSNTVALNEMPFRDDLQKLLKLPIQISNDANCFALAETLMGVVPQADPQARVVFGIIMGTGVGGGIVVNGKTINGRHGIAGEWGHNYLDESGGKCYCGKTGCVETVISGPALEKYYARLTGKTYKLPEIVKKQTSDVHAMATVNRLHRMFGKAVANVINILDPDVIVLGGGVGNIDSIATKGVKEIKPHLFNPVLETRVVKPKLGDSAGVFGAAMLVKKN
jgi:fructokinase